MTRALRRAAALSAGAAMLVALAGCAPDRVEVTEHADAVFADLVDAVSAIDAQTLRTLETSPVQEVSCADREVAQAQVRTATGTLSIEADDQDAVAVFEAVHERLPRAAWDPIRHDRDLTQRVWAAEDGVVVAVTASGPVITFSVFTPCLP